MKPTETDDFLDTVFGEPISTTPEDDEGMPVYRLKTSMWHDKNGAYLRKELRLMKRLSGHGHDVFQESLDNVGASEAIERITNLYECEDGLYTIVMTNISKDWETGHADDWDYALIPHTPAKQTKKPCLSKN